MVTEISNVELSILIVRHSSVFLRWLKAEGILEVIHHTLDISLGYPRNNLIIGLRLLNALKVATK